MEDEKEMISHSEKKAKAKRNLKVKPAKTITIMADFGFGPYAWLKDASDQTDYVGLKIADRKTGMTKFHVSQLLDADFAQWIDRFERYALDKPAKARPPCRWRPFSHLREGNPGFDWKTFHQEGILLAKRLKQEVGNLANVLYVKPAEDPDHGVKEKNMD